MSLLDKKYSLKFLNIWVSTFLDTLTGQMLPYTAVRLQEKIMPKKAFEKLRLCLKDKNLKVVVLMAFGDLSTLDAIGEALKEGLVKEATLVVRDEEASTAFNAGIKETNAKAIMTSSFDEMLKITIAEVKASNNDVVLFCDGFNSFAIKIAVQALSTESAFLSHIACFKLPDKEKLMLLTDCFVNESPDEATVVKEIKNAQKLYCKLFGESVLKVALLAANEKVSDKMPATKLAKAVSENFFSNKEVIVEGPVSFDLAISPNSAEIKKYEGRIKGDADILVAPRVETGDILYKSFQRYIKLETASVIYGADFPIVCSFSGDSAKNKLNSLILGLNLGR